MASTRSRLKNGNIKAHVRREQLRWAKPVPRPEDPRGIPSEVMKTLSLEGVSSDPVRFNARLQELLAAYKQNGG